LLPLDDDDEDDDDEEEEEAFSVKPTLRCRL
jgi:hypothetical protein